MGNDDLSAVFATVARGIDPDLRDVIDQARQQGRRRRGRRRVTIAASAAMSVAVIATGVTGARLGLRTAFGASPAGPGKASHTRHHHPKSHRVPQAHGPGMTARHVLAVLRPMLPPGKITYVYPLIGRGGVDINFDDGKGSVDIMMWVASAPRPRPLPHVRFPPSMSASEKARILQAEYKHLQQTRKLACPHPPWTDDGKRPAGAPPISCVMRTLPDGSIELDSVTYADAASFYGYQIEEQRPDGIRVWIQVGNGTLGGTPHLTRPGWPYVDRARPPGSMALWAAIVESPKWHL